MSTSDTIAAVAGRPADRRPLWRSVAIPSEHGGWGLTGEPILLGLVIAFSWAGIGIGIVALLAFLVRTPLKLAIIDLRRNRSLDRTPLARLIAGGELSAIAVLAVFAIVTAGWTWLLPIAAAAPFVAVELWFDVRSRGRRLVPEVSGSIGIAAVAASIVLADDGSARLAVAVWLILAGRAIASISFVRTQIERLRHGTAPLRLTDALQALGVAVAIVAAVIEPAVAVGTGAIVLLAVVQFILVRRAHVPPAKVIGLTQMALGLAVVAAAATGVLALT